MNKRQRAKRRRQRWERKRRVDTIRRFLRSAGYRWLGSLPRPMDALPPEVSYDFNAGPTRIYYSAGGLAAFERLVAVEPPPEVSHGEDCG